MTTEFVCKDLHVSVQGLAPLVFALGAMMVLNADMTKTAPYAERMDRMADDRIAELQAGFGALNVVIFEAVQAIVDGITKAGAINEQDQSAIYGVISERLFLAVENAKEIGPVDVDVLKEMATGFDQRARGPGSPASMQ